MVNSLSIIIPCLNEEASIAEVVRAAQAGFAKAGIPGEVIVVDNGSADRSAVKPPPLSWHQEWGKIAR